jgi:hypothetical protein
MLTIIGEAPYRSRHQMVRVRCDCGVEKEIRRAHVLSGAVVSCGCAKKRHGDAAGVRPKPTYVSWQAMMSRCYTTSHSAYANYGGRGITVCERWHTYEMFLADMGERPLGLSLDRVDNALGYEPGNCRWSTASEQAQNQRRTVLSMAIAAQIRDLYGQGVPQAEIARRLSVSKGSVSYVVRGRSWR